MKRRKYDPKRKRRDVMGRPTDFSVELADRICERIANSPRGLVHLCSEKGMPARTTIHRWLRENKDFQDKYTRAKELQADLLAEQSIDIADDSTNDRDAEGEIDNEVVQRSRLRVDTRKWLAGKLRPKVYGDRLQVDGIDNKPAQHLHLHAVLKDKDDDALAKLYQEAVNGTLTITEQPARADD